METHRGAKAPLSRLKVSAKVKTFVLDTNVLLHDPQCVFKFEDNNLAIPVEVLEELDGIKGEQSTERGRNARRVHRILQELLPDSRSMHEGVELPNGGTLSIRTANVTIGETMSFGQVLMPSGDYVTLDVEDKGLGIPKEHLGKIFEPFFTTRRGHGGSGLGLHIAHQIVTQRFGGTISLDTSPGAGSSWCVRLPAHTDALRYVEDP